MKTAYYDSGLRWGDPNMRWGNPSYLLEPGDPGYVPPSTPITNNNMNHKPHCPVPTIAYNGSLIVAASQKYPNVDARLPAGYLTATTTALAKLPTDISGQMTAKGETGNLTAAQQINLDALLHCMSQARKTAKLSFPGETVKLHDEFQIGLHDSHELSAVLSRADTILASVQIAANLAAMKLKGWTDADTTNFTTVRGTFPASSVAQQSGESSAKTATVTKGTDAADAYEHLLTIQNAGDLEFPAINPANAPARAEFRLGIFPPEHHVTHAAPTPPPTPPAPSIKF